MKIDWKPKNGLEKSGLKVARFLTNQGEQAFFVGGFVRDMLLKRQSDNLDIATSAKPEKVERALKHFGLRYKTVGKKFGTILAITGDGPIETTTFRSEGRYSDKRHPDKVNFIADYTQDAKRRDLTINALYFDPHKSVVLDPIGGLKDLARKLIRFVGDPKKRIDEDALRMLRAVRFSVQLGFKIEKNSFAATKTRAKYIQNIAGERIKQELDKILVTSGKIEGLRLLDNIGLLAYLSPELVLLHKVLHKSKHYHLEGSAFNHVLLAVKALKLDDLNLSYAALFHDSGKTNTGKKVKKAEGLVYSYKGHAQASVKIFQKFAKRLRFPSKDSKLVMWLIAEHDKDRKFFEMSKEDQVNYASQPYFDLLLDLWQADVNGNLTTSENDWYKNKRLSAYRLGLKIFRAVSSKQKLLDEFLDGNTVMKTLGLKPGPKVGKILKMIRGKIVLGEINSLDEMKKFLYKQKNT